jgi:flagellar motor switch protein FliG
MANLDDDQIAEYERLSMADKVAILLMQLGESISTSMLSLMDISVISEITKSISNKQNISRNIAHAVVEEFYGILLAGGSIATGGSDYAKELLYKTLPPDQANKLIDKLSKNVVFQENFKYLSKVSPGQISDFIISEHPQTIALIMAHMSPSAAAESMLDFEDELRAEVAIRMANLGEISPDIVKRVSLMLENKLEVFSGSKVQVGGHRSVAEIFNRLGQQISRNTLSHIEQLDNSLANSIKEMMFTFDDIERLDANSIRMAMAKLDNKILALALKTATPELKNKFLNNMSARASVAFEEEMQLMGAVKLKDVETAQRSVIEHIQGLADMGEIELNAGNDEMIE